MNSHADAIKTLEGKLSLLSAQLKPKIMIEDDYRGLVVVTQSGKVAIGNVMGNEDAQKHKECGRHGGTRVAYLSKPCQKTTKESGTTCSNSKSHATFTENTSTISPILDFETIEVSYNCTAIMTKELVKKREDPEAFTIPCTIGMLQFAKALCDLGASINLMPYEIYKKLGLGEPKATTMRLLMANHSIKHPMGILYDILVKVNQPFLATGRALVDVESGELRFRVNEDEVTFNICKSMKHPSDIHVVSTDDIIDEAVASVSHLMCMNEPFEAVLVNYDESKIQGYKEVVSALTGLGGYSKTPVKLDIDLKNRESPPAKPSIEEPPNLELKALLSHL
ncbi:hypothetical protein R3W88_024856 [Solanum pinnatisectum]|uniref:Aspartic peptidase DDI1-type domain-containing protein n=1 Tax=Solanum pinnatisectum TaxID=50273 RepID=A0AAV9M2E6_9SOLN|nr:hypothetical protein R3W88_024856 [Solanum pinnatisectum]